MISRSKTAVSAAHSFYRRSLAASDIWQARQLSCA